MNTAARIAAYVSFTAALAGAAACAAPPAEEDGDTTEDAVSARERVTTARVQTSEAQRKEIAQKKATCPFVGAMVYLKKLPILNSVDNPLASIDDIVAIGNGRGGSLGGIVLKLFATGNHAKMAGKNANGTENFNKTVPAGTFSLDFPPSQGAHPGHSGILLSGTRRDGYRGELNQAAFDRLAGRAVEQNGVKYLKTSSIGAYIWDNVWRDRAEAKFVGNDFGDALAEDVGNLLSTLVSRADHREKAAAVVKLTGTNHVIASAGEFALLFAILEVPGKEIDGDKVVRLSDVRMMFEEKKMPEGWDTRPLEASAWVEHTTAILKGAECARPADARQALPLAARAYLRLHCP